MGHRTATIIWGLSVILAGLVLPPSRIQAADIFIGAGSRAQVDFDVARALCRQIIRAIDNLTCEVERIEGGDAPEPLAVLSDVRTGAIETGLVPADWQYYAVRKAGPLAFLEIGFDSLRSLFSLHSEAFTIVARRDSGIDSLEDLAGKRINIGNPGSRQRTLMDMVIQAQGWTRDTFRLVEELPASEQSLALCHDRVQAIVVLAAHPDPALAKLMKRCDARIVDVAGAGIDRLLAANEFLATTYISQRRYEGMRRPTRTFGIAVTVTGSMDMADDQAYALVAAIFDNLDRFKQLHPVLGTLTPEGMLKDGLSAPLHPGAVRYFRDRGMM
ncbi:MAG: TAXI family TRAP transporter solute-binding subunit [Alphaproteobacteria bacterium]|nr:MAG: TAXI family TRAP transporter solute-binding subunit [Alphaproteobacteria bacterium]